MAKKSKKNEYQDKHGVQQSKNRNYTDCKDCDNCSNKREENATDCHRPNQYK